MILKQDSNWKKNFREGTYVYKTNPISRFHQFYSDSKKKKHSSIYLGWRDNVDII